MRTDKKLKRRLYIDTNVLIGYFRNQKADVQAMDYMFKLRDCELYTSALAISQTISTIQGKRRDPLFRKNIIDFVMGLMHKIHVVSLAATDISAALELPNIDIEDNIQFIVGEKQRCYIYVPNNQKDFKYNNVVIVSPRYIRSIQANIH